METNKATQAISTEAIEEAKLKYPVQKRHHKEVIEEKEVKHAVKDLNPDMSSMGFRG